MREEITAKKKRYAFVGNMNNMPFLYAREIKNRKLDAVLFLDAPQNFKLDRPESCDPNITDPYPDWIRQINVPKINHFFKRLFPSLFYRGLIRTLNSYDVVVLNGNWITLAPYLGSTIIVYALCAGYEIDALCDFEEVTISAESIIYKAPWFATINFRFLTRLINVLLLPVLNRRISLQRKGLARSDGISYYPSGISPRGDALINEIMGEKKYRRLELRGLPTYEYTYSEPLGNKNFTILNFTRFSFLTGRLDDKRNDIMLEGIGFFLKEMAFPDDVEVIFFDKGEERSLKIAKETINRSNYGKFVTWMGQVPQNELFNSIVPNCDVAFDQLGDQWVGAGLYAMLIGRPVIANGRPEIFERLTGEVSPVCQASTPQDVCFWLKKLYTDRTEIKQIGLNSRIYVDKHYNMNKTVGFFLQE